MLSRFNIHTKEKIETPSHYCLMTENGKVAKENKQCRRNDDEEGPYFMFK
jgi:hypothetical protein